MRYERSFVLALALSAMGACEREGNGSPVAANAICEVVQPPVTLPRGLDETSGLAISGADPETLWSHNDSGGEPELYSIGRDGSRVGTVRVAGARNRDWEDMSAGPCPAGRCLFIGDFGDNEAVRDEVAVYLVPEPDPTGGPTLRAERFPFTYPGGPRDAEAMFVLPSGELYVVSKGRTSNVSLYRYPQPFRRDEVVEMEHVGDLTSTRPELAQQVTSAEASPDGEWVAIRSYAALMLYRSADLLAGRAATSLIDLSPLGEPQGEAVAMYDDGLVVLTSEASGEGPSGTLAVLRCSVDAEPSGAGAAEG